MIKNIVNSDTEQYIVKEAVVKPLHKKPDLEFIEYTLLNLLPSLEEISYITETITI